MSAASVGSCGAAKPASRRASGACPGIRREWLFGCLMLPGLIGCAGMVGAADDGRDSASTRLETRLELNEGYSLLHRALSDVRHTDKLLYVKLESERVQQVIGAASSYASELRSDLERIAREYPDVDVDLEPLPEMERRKRAALKRSSLARMAPLVGQSGPVFERSLLLSTSGILNHLRFQARALGEAEPERSLRDVMRDAEERLAALHDQALRLLDEVYFSDDTGR